VKVKKKEKCEHCYDKGQIVEKPKGNWVNGENIDKIKFPVPCSYQKFKNEKCFGLLIDEYKGYKIVPLEKQRCSLLYPFDEDLKHFIESWDIHILKGKLILYEEE
jgi:hypothetical protein